MSKKGETATAILDFLHGARKLPPENAAAKLREFANSLSSLGDQSEPLIEAQQALIDLAQALETNKVASDDNWQKAIQTSVSLANEAV